MSDHDQVRPHIDIAFKIYYEYQIMIKLVVSCTSLKAVPGDVQVTTTTMLRLLAAPH